VINEPSFNLVAAGDVMLGDSSHFLGRGVGFQVTKHGPDFPFSRVKESIQKSDLFFANLESPLANTAGNKSWDLVYRGAAEAASGLLLAPANVVSVANNHILEHGQKVLAETQTILTKNNIGYAGYDAIDTSSNIVWHKKIKDLDVSLFAVSLIKDFSGVGSNPDRVQEKLIEEIQQCQSDVVIVSIHWGNEYIHTPSPDQIEFGHALIESGVDLVIGHHPHVLQPVEEYGQGLIAYSLGNFVFDQSWGQATQTGGLLNVTLGKGGVIDWNFVPTLINDQCQPEVAKGRVAQRFTSLISEKVGVPWPEYKECLAKNSREYRIRMKLELLRNFWKVKFPTIHFLLTKRNRPRPVIVGPDDKTT